MFEVLQQLGKEGSLRNLAASQHRHHQSNPAASRTAEAVWKRTYLLHSLNNQEMLDEAFY